MPQQCVSVVRCGLICCAESFYLFISASAYYQVTVGCFFPYGWLNVSVYISYFSRDLIILSGDEWNQISKVLLTLWGGDDDSGFFGRFSAVSINQWGSEYLVHRINPSRSASWDSVPRSWNVWNPVLTHEMC